MLLFTQKPSNILVNENCDLKVRTAGLLEDAGLTCSDRSVTLDLHGSKTHR